MSAVGTLAYVGLGSNLGHPFQQIHRALRWLDLQPGTRLLRAAPLAVTEPVGPPQPNYVNTVAELRTSLSPVGLLRALQRLERAAQRRRNVRWGARTLDLDLLFHGHHAIDHPDLALPHPGVPERRFVLEPMAHLAPNFRHPLLDQTMADLLLALDA